MPRTPRLLSELDLNTDPLEFFLSGLDALFLLESDAVDPVLARIRDSVRVVRIDLRLRLLLDRRLELRRLVDHRGVLLSDHLSAYLFERLLHRPYNLAARIVSRQ